MFSGRPSIGACVPYSLGRRYFIKRSEEFHQIYNYGAIRESDKD